MTTTLSIRIDEDLKADAEEFFSDIGMNLTTAITCFFKKCIDVGEIPFKLGRRKHVPNPETIAALEEDNRIVNDPTRKRFTNLEDLWEDLEK